MLYAVYNYPENGHSFEQDKCQEIGLVVGKEYEISSIRVGGISSTVQLRDFPKEHFNSVFFDYYEYHNGMKYEVDVYSRFYQDPYL